LRCQHTLHTRVPMALLNMDQLCWLSESMPA
jgi:hypothetical protein